MHVQPPVLINQLMRQNFMKPFLKVWVYYMQLTQKLEKYYRN